MKSEYLGNQTEEPLYQSLTYEQAKCLDQVSKSLSAHPLGCSHRPLKHFHQQGQWTLPLEAPVVQPEAILEIWVPPLKYTSMNILSIPGSGHSGQDPDMLKQLVQEKGGLWEWIQTQE